MVAGSNQINDDVLERVNRKWHVGTMIVHRGNCYGSGYSVAQRGNTSDIGSTRLIIPVMEEPMPLNGVLLCNYQNLSSIVGLQYLFGKMSYQRVSSSLVDSAYS